MIYPKSSSNRACSRVLSSVTAVVWRSPSVYKYRVARRHSAVSHDQQCHQDSIMLHTPLHLPSGCGISPTQIVEYAQINININILIHKYLILYIHSHTSSERMLILHSNICRYSGHPLRSAVNSYSVTPLLGGIFEFYTAHQES